jgi:hypothetical protein
LSTHPSTSLNLKPSNDVPLLKKKKSSKIKTLLIFVIAFILIIVVAVAGLNSMGNARARDRLIGIWHQDGTLGGSHWRFEESGRFTYSSQMGAIFGTWTVTGGGTRVEITVGNVVDMPRPITSRELVNILTGSGSSTINTLNYNIVFQNNSQVSIGNNRLTK